MQLTVIHSHPVWLPATMTWLDNEVRFLPSDVTSHIVCERTMNLGQFELPSIHSLQTLPAWRRRLDLGLVRLRIRRSLGFLTRVLRETNADLLHSHFGNIGWANLAAARKCGVRHVVTFYGRDISHLPHKRPIWRSRYPELFDAADLVLCEGAHMAARVAEFGCPPSKLTVHHLGVRLDALPFRNRSWNRAGGKPLRILIAAQFREKKGIPDAIDAIGKVAPLVPIEVTVIGDAGSRRDLEEKKTILERVALHGLADRVRFLGMQPHAVMIEEAYRHHVYLSPSMTASDGDTEGGVAVALIEMAATGIPVVATTHCDTPGVLTHGISGLLAPERDVDALAQHILQLAEHPEDWGTMAGAARRHIEDEFDARTQGLRLAAAYRSVTREEAREGA